MLQRARRVLFCVTACLASVVTRCSVLAESSLALRHDWRVLSCAQHAQRVQSCVTPCSASAVSRYRMLEECSLVL